MSKRDSKNQQKVIDRNSKFVEPNLVPHSKLDNVYITQ